MDRGRLCNARCASRASLRLQSFSTVNLYLTTHHFFYHGRSNDHPARQRLEVVATE